MDKDEAVKLLESSNSEDEWNANVNKVKSACGGYPSWWFPTVVQSGLVARVAAKFGGDPNIRIVPIKSE